MSHIIVLAIAVILVVLGGLAAASRTPEKTVEILAQSTAISLAIIALASKLAEMSKKADESAKVQRDTHTLVNSTHGAALLTIVELTRANAERTGSEADREKARAADEVYRSHLAKQSVVDARNAGEQ